LDQLCLAEGHYFLPLPPYSPELNPIEKAWANLKRAITELLKTFKTVNESLLYYFKTQ
ncbi:transposase, partial [Streptococcus acidominimus]